MSDEIVVIGLSMTPLGHMLERTVKAPALQTLSGVVADAGVERCHI